MATRDWRDHILWPSVVGRPESERPIFIGPNPAIQNRRDYMYRYLWWATSTPRDWFDVTRPEAERLTAQVWTDAGYERMGNDHWEFLVDSTLWNIAFHVAGWDRRPSFPWQDPSDTAGGDSETYMHLKVYRRAEVEADEFLDRLAQRLADADSEADQDRES